ncbi:hypothetical protein FE257_007188 [Aspergillus nanangensis]|uniref:Uncharacterized protein n=1 Tax=Aspergillus nanangensis TaxID=2582783 RepID=A0AAD4CMW8_ASPNN|nr:hypothetical protein FE257_007188 [Aspergillus nanangensis]
MPQRSSNSTDITGERPTGPSKYTPYESPFSYSSLRHRHEARRHSFRVPDLPAIPSSCSEASEVSDSSSRSASPGAVSCEILTQSRFGESRRESCDEDFAKYLLSIAARSAERELKDQALAAFPNEQVYQPVDHFAIDREEEDTPPEEQISYGGAAHLRHRRASSADLSFELEYMRRHKEEAEMRHRAMAGTGYHILSHTNLPTGQSSDPIDTRLVDNFNRERERESPRKMHTKSPPMLGGDLVFTQSLSPQTTICESLTPKFENRMHTPQPTESACFQDIAKQRPPQESLDSEINDGFVTQIYNYLSIGYPCVARYYDHELSKVSGISLADLRRDDLNMNAKGYVGVSERSHSDEESGNEACMRWIALRLYIYEWAKQFPTMAEGDNDFTTWGAQWPVIPAGKPWVSLGYLNTYGNPICVLFLSTLCHSSWQRATVLGPPMRITWEYFMLRETI